MMQYKPRWSQGFCRVNSEDIYAHVYAGTPFIWSRTLSLPYSHAEYTSLKKQAI